MTLSVSFVSLFMSISIMARYGPMTIVNKGFQLTIKQKILSLDLSKWNKLKPRFSLAVRSTSFPVYTLKSGEALGSANFASFHAQSIVAHKFEV